MKETKNEMILHIEDMDYTVRMDLFEASKLLSTYKNLSNIVEVLTRGEKSHGRREEIGSRTTE